MILLICLLLPCAANSTATSQPVSSQPIWVDTDLCIDDWMALAYLIQQPQFHIVAITVENDGINDCAHGMAQLHAFLHLTKNDDIPIACANTSPLQGKQHFPLPWRVAAEKFYGLNYPVNSDSSIMGQRKFIAFVHNILQAQTKPVTLFALAPLTNIAKVCQKEPHLLAAKISKVYFLGGNPGGVAIPQGDPSYTYNQAASWNIFIDPTAFAVVLDAMRPLQLSLITLSATLPLENKASMAIYQQLLAKKQQADFYFSPATQFVYELLSQTKATLIADDAVAAVFAVHPDICQQQIKPIRPNIHNGYLQRDITISSSGVPSYLCAHVKPEQLVRDYLNGILTIKKS